MHVLHVYINKPELTSMSIPITTVSSSVLESLPSSCPLKDGYLDIWQYQTHTMYIHTTHQQNTYFNKLFPNIMHSRGKECVMFTVFSSIKRCLVYLPPSYKRRTLTYSHWNSHRPQKLYLILSITWNIVRRPVNSWMKLFLKMTVECLVSYFCHYFTFQCTDINWSQVTYTCTMM